VYNQIYFADFIFVFQRYLNINPRGQFNTFDRSGQRLNWKQQIGKFFILHGL